MSNEDIIANIKMGIMVQYWMQLLYINNKKYLHSLILKNGIKSNEDTEDAIQNAFFGMAEAVEKFDLNKGVKFLTFATNYINTAIREGYNTVNSQKCFSINRYTSERFEKVKHAKKILTAELDREPTIHEIAERSYIGFSATEAILSGLTPHCSVYEVVPGTKDALIIDCIEDRESNTESKIENYEIIKVLHNSVNALPSHLKEILLQIYFFERSASELARLYNESVNSVKNKEKKALFLLRTNTQLKQLYYA